MSHVVAVCFQFRDQLFEVIVLRIMAPKSKITAAVFQERYGDLVAREYAHCATAYALRVALAKRFPPIVVSDAMLKVWFQTQRIPDGALKVSSAQELQEKCGSFCCIARRGTSVYV